MKHIERQAQWISIYKVIWFNNENVLPSKLVKDIRHSASFI